MTTKQLAKEVAGLAKEMEAATDVTAHVGIALQAMALIKDHATEKSPDAVHNLYSDPFYAYFQGAASDLHTAFPVRKLAMIQALEGFRKYISSEKVIAGPPDSGLK